MFGGKSDALREFVREYFEDNENEHIAAAVALCERERSTLGSAARLADVGRWTMRDILREHGVELRFGLVDEDDAAHEVGTANGVEFDDEDLDDAESPTN